MKQRYLYSKPIIVVIVPHLVNFLLLLFRLLFHLLLNLKELFVHLVAVLAQPSVQSVQEKESLLLGHQREQGTFAQP
jgi:hypothetical protein